MFFLCVLMHLQLLMIVIMISCSTISLKQCQNCLLIQICQRNIASNTDSVYLLMNQKLVFVGCVDLFVDDILSKHWHTAQHQNDMQ